MSRASLLFFPIPILPKALSYTPEDHYRMFGYPALVDFDGKCDGLLWKEIEGDKHQYYSFVCQMCASSHLKRGGMVVHTVLHVPPKAMNNAKTLRSSKV